MNWRRNKFKREPDQCHDDMGSGHSQAMAESLVCPECGLDFRYSPPRANMTPGRPATIPAHRFYGVDEDGWLIGDSTEEFDIDRWVETREIDTTKPHGRRPTPLDVETGFRHGPFYVEQGFLTAE